MNIANNSDKSIRADVLLAQANPKYSRAALTKLFDMGNIMLDGLVIRPGDKIKPGQIINANIKPINKPAEDIDLPIIYEDEDVIVIDKPVGVISHARGRYWDEASVASFIRTKISGIEGERAGIVHRLDRVTSGVMICAKNPGALSYLQKQFNNRTVYKSYLAVIKGVIDPKEGIIDVPLGRNPKEPNKFMIRKDGKPSKTEYHTVKSHKEYSLVKLHPLTGRTHQIRLHLSFMHRPIVGDELYGGEEAGRLMLHAKSLEITLPSSERKVFESETPPEFSEYIQ